MIIINKILFSVIYIPTTPVPQCGTVHVLTSSSRQVGSVPWATIAPRARQSPLPVTRENTVRHPA